MQTYVRAQKTVSVGSCAPGPIWTLAPELMRLLPEKTISSEVGEPDALLDRVEVPILDSEASITFWLCTLRKNRKLLEHVPDVAGNR